MVKLSQEEKLIGARLELIQMRDGFVKVAAVSPQLKVADCEFNEAVIYETIKAAAEANTALVVLPELAITGCSCGDLFFQKKLYDTAKKCLANLVNRCAWPVVAVVGLPFEMEGNFYDCAAVMFNGRLLGIVPKATVSETFGRWFSLWDSKNCTVEFDGQIVPFGSKFLFQAEQMHEFCFGCEIGDGLFAHAPISEKLADSGANIIVNCAADAQLAGRSEYRRVAVTAQSARLGVCYLFANAADGESSSETVFAGENIIAENGNLIACSKPFGSGFCATVADTQLLNFLNRKTSRSKYSGEFDTISFDMQQRETRIERPYAMQPFVPEKKEERARRAEEVLQIQAHALAKRIRHVGAKSLVLGISGGLDSTLAALVCVRALDIENRPHSDLKAYTMPCFGTTGRTKDNSQLLCEALGVELCEIDIKKSVQQHFKDIGHSAKVFDAAFENAQARERTQVLMDIANMKQGLMIGTGDLSEIALGWATFNGDHISMYGVNSTVPKTLIRAIVKYVADTTENEKLKKVLEDILRTPVSPELLPAKDGQITQKTEELVGSYELHDFFLYWFIKGGFTPRKLCRLAKYAFGGDYSEKEILQTLRKFLTRFFSQQFKRNCQADGVRTGTISLSPACWRMPSDAVPALWLSEMEEIEEEYKIRSERKTTTYEQFKKNRRAKAAGKTALKETKKQPNAIDTFLKRFSADEKDK